jgi:hypothetical protein
MGSYLDFNLANFDTVALLTPVTPAANKWVAKHLPDNLIRWGGGVASEARNLAVVKQQINDSGLLVEAD